MLHRKQRPHLFGVLGSLATLGVEFNGLPDRACVPVNRIYFGLFWSRPHCATQLGKEPLVRSFQRSEATMCQACRSFFQAMNLNQLKLPAYTQSRIQIAPRVDMCSPTLIYIFICIRAQQALSFASLSNRVVPSHVDLLASPMELHAVSKATPSSN